MPEVNSKVMAMVEEELRKNPEISTEELFQKAVKLDKEIGKLSARQFNARYPLQVKRRNAPRRTRRPAESRPRGRAVKVGGADRTAIRSVLLQFAKDIAAAEEKADVVDVIGGVDKYVERVIAAAGAR